MRKYKITDNSQHTDMWGWSHDAPITANELRSMFWAYDEQRTEFYKQFTLNYIGEAWGILIEPVNK